MLILWIREHVILHGKKDFTDVIKIKEFEIGTLLWIIYVGSS